jgi:hypothetical protein
LKLYKLSKERRKREKEELWMEKGKICQSDLEGKNIGDVEDNVGKEGTKREVMIREFRPLMDKTNHQLTFGKRKINVVVENLREMFT